jgi:hypothetical protein
MSRCDAPPWQALTLGHRPWPSRHPRQLILKILRQIIFKMTAGALFAEPKLECYIVTMINPQTLHPLSPAAGAGARLILAAMVLGVVWLAVIWALS